MTLSAPPLKVERVPLARFTTLGVGGEAEVWTVHDHAQLMAAMDAPYRVLGGGSNLVISDDGVPERVLRLAGEFAVRDLERDASLSGEGGYVTGWVGGGVPLPGLVRELARRGLSGLEGTVGIPAQVGGAVWMNAGTRYGEMFDALHSLEIATPGRVRVVTPSELDHGYRKSGIGRDEIVTRVRLTLTPTAPEDVTAKMTFADEARKGQPKMKTPGCAFKNPGGVSAGRLIDEAGLKGYRVGNAMISHEHANFIVNLGGARAADVLAILEHVRSVVGVPLELEYELWP